MSKPIEAAEGVAKRSGKNVKQKSRQEPGKVICEIESTVLTKRGLAAKRLGDKYKRKQAAESAEKQTGAAAPKQLVSAKPVRQNVYLPKPIQMAIVYHDTASSEYDEDRAGALRALLKQHWSEDIQEAFVLSASSAQDATLLYAMLSEPTLKLAVSSLSTLYLLVLYGVHPRPDLLTECQSRLSLITKTELAKLIPELACLKQYLREDKIMDLVLAAARRLNQSYQLYFNRTIWLEHANEQGLENLQAFCETPPTFSDSQATQPAAEIPYEADDESPNFHGKHAFVHELRTTCYKADGTLDADKLAKIAIHVAPYVEGSWFNLGLDQEDCLTIPELNALTAFYETAEAQEADPQKKACYGSIKTDLESAARYAAYLEEPLQGLSDVDREAVLRKSMSECVEKAKSGDASDLKKLIRKIIYVDTLDGEVLKALMMQMTCNRKSLLDVLFDFKDKEAYQIAFRLSMPEMVFKKNANPSEGLLENPSLETVERGIYDIERFKDFDAYPTKKPLHQGSYFLLSLVKLSEMITLKAEKRARLIILTLLTLLKKEAVFRPWFVSFVRLFNQYNDSFLSEFDVDIQRKLADILQPGQPCSAYLSQLNNEDLLGFSRRFELNLTLPFFSETDKQAFRRANATVLRVLSDRFEDNLKKLSFTELLRVPVEGCPLDYVHRYQLVILNHPELDVDNFDFSATVSWSAWVVLLEAGVQLPDDFSVHQVLSIYEYAIFFGDVYAIVNQRLTSLFQDASVINAIPAESRIPILMILLNLQEKDWVETLLRHPGFLSFATAAQQYSLFVELVNVEFSSDFIKWFGSTLPDNVLSQLDALDPVIILEGLFPYQKFTNKRRACIEKYLSMQVSSLSLKQGLNISVLIIISKWIADKAVKDTTVLNRLKKDLEVLYANLIPDAILSSIRQLHLGDDWRVLATQEGHFRKRLLPCHLSWLCEEAIALRDPNLLDAAVTGCEMFNETISLSNPAACFSLLAGAESALIDKVSRYILVSSSGQKTDYLTILKIIFDQDISLFLAFLLRYKVRFNLGDVFFDNHAVIFEYLLSIFHHIGQPGLQDWMLAYLNQKSPDKIQSWLLPVSPRAMRCIREKAAKFATLKKQIVAGKKPENIDTVQYLSRQLVYYAQFPDALNHRRLFECQADLKNITHPALMAVLDRALVYHDAEMIEACLRCLDLAKYQEEKIDAMHIFTLSAHLTQFQGPALQARKRQSLLRILRKLFLHYLSSLSKDSLRERLFHLFPEYLPFVVDPDIKASLTRYLKSNALPGLFEFGEQPESAPVAEPYYSKQAFVDEMEAYCKTESVDLRHVKVILEKGVTFIDSICFNLNDPTHYPRQASSLSANALAWLLMAAREKLTEATASSDQTNSQRFAVLSAMLEQAHEVANLLADPFRGLSDEHKTMVETTPVYHLLVKPKEEEQVLFKHRIAYLYNRNKVDLENELSEIIAYRQPDGRVTGVNAFSLMLVSNDLCWIQICMKLSPLAKPFISADQEGQIPFHQIFDDLCKANNIAITNQLILHLFNLGDSEIQIQFGIMTKHTALHYIFYKQFSVMNPVEIAKRMLSGLPGQLAKNQPVDLVKLQMLVFLRGLHALVSNEKTELLQWINRFDNDVQDKLTVALDSNDLELVAFVYEHYLDDDAQRAAYNDLLPLVVNKASSNLLLALNPTVNDFPGDPKRYFQACLQALEVQFERHDYDRCARNVKVLLQLCQWHTQDVLHLVGPCFELLGKLRTCAKTEKAEKLLQKHAVGFLKLYPASHVCHLSSSARRALNGIIHNELSTQKHRLPKHIAAIEKAEDLAKQVKHAQVINQLPIHALKQDARRDTQSQIFRKQQALIAKAKAVTGEQMQAWLDADNYEAAADVWLFGAAMPAGLTLIQEDRVLELASNKVMSMIQQENWLAFAVYLSMHGSIPDTLTLEEGLIVLESAYHPAESKQLLLTWLVDKISHAKASDTLALPDDSNQTDLCNLLLLAYCCQTDNPTSPNKTAQSKLRKFLSDVACIPLLRDYELGGLLSYYVKDQKSFLTVVAEQDIEWVLSVGISLKDKRIIAAVKKMLDSSPWIRLNLEVFKTAMTALLDDAKSATKKSTELFIEICQLEKSLLRAFRAMAIDFVIICAEGNLNKKLFEKLLGLFDGLDVDNLQSSCERLVAYSLKHLDSVIKQDKLFALFLKSMKTLPEEVKSSQLADADLATLNQLKAHKTTPKTVKTLVTPIISSKQKAQEKLEAEKAEANQVPDAPKQKGASVESAVASDVVSEKKFEAKDVATSTEGLLVSADAKTQTRNIISKADAGMQTAPPETVETIEVAPQTVCDQVSVAAEMEPVQYSAREVQTELKGEDVSNQLSSLDKREERLSEWEGRLKVLDSSLQEKERQLNAWEAKLRGQQYALQQALFAQQVMPPVTHAPAYVMPGSGQPAVVAPAAFYQPARMKPAYDYVSTAIITGGVVQLDDNSAQPNKLTLSDSSQIKDGYYNICCKNGGWYILKLDDPSGRSTKIMFELSEEKVQFTAGHFQTQLYKDGVSPPAPTAGT